MPKKQSNGFIFDWQDLALTLGASPGAMAKVSADWGSLTDEKIGEWESRAQSNLESPENVSFLCALAADGDPQRRRSMIQLLETEPCEWVPKVLSDWVTRSAPEFLMRWIPNEKDYESLNSLASICMKRLPDVRIQKLLLSDLPDFGPPAAFQFFDWLTTTETIDPSLQDFAKHLWKNFEERHLLDELDIVQDAVSQHPDIVPDLGQYRKPGKVYAEDLKGLFKAPEEAKQLAAGRLFWEAGAEVSMGQYKNGILHAGDIVVEMDGPFAWSDDGRFLCGTRDHKSEVIVVDIAKQRETSYTVPDVTFHIPWKFSDGRFYVLLDPPNSGPVDTGKSASLSPAEIFAA